MLFNQEWHRGNLQLLDDPYLVARGLQAPATARADLQT